MAPSRDHKGKTTDRSTDWSEPVWDERGFYVSSRKNSLGDWVYDYRYPDETRTQQDLQTVPRSPGPNVLVNSYFPAARSSGASSYGTYAGSSTSNSATQYGNSYGYGPAASAQNTTPSPYFEAPPLAATSISYAATPSAASAAGGNFGTLYTSAPTYESSSAAIGMTDQFSRLSVNTGLSELVPVSQPTSWYPAQASSSQGNPRTLNANYRVVDQKSKTFWRPGRVFAALWTEPATGIKKLKGAASTQYSETWLNGVAYTEIRRFVILSDGHGNCICSPIHTYGSQGTLKDNLADPDAHAIIYTSSSPPSELSYKEDGITYWEDLSKDPIKVKSEQDGPEGKLHPASRLNYSKLYTVEKHIRVLKIGMVENLPSLLKHSRVKPSEPPTERHRSHRPDTGKSGDKNKKRS